jgi:hypothetical protein
MAFSQPGVGLGFPIRHIEGNIVSHIRGRRAVSTADDLSSLLGLSNKHIYKMAKVGQKQAIA